MYVNSFDLVVYEAIYRSNGISHVFKLSNFYKVRPLLAFINSSPEKKVGNNMINSELKTFISSEIIFKDINNSPPSLLVLTYKTQKVKLWLFFRDGWPQFLAQETI